MSPSLATPWGRTPTLLAAGVELNIASNQPINLSQVHTLRRTIHALGHESDPLYDSGPFVSGISAYLAISGGTYTGDSTLTVIDPARPNLTGKDLMQQPFMLMSGTNDALQNTNGESVLAHGGTACYHDAVDKPFGVCPSPAYAVILNGANHLTPVSKFGGLSSALAGTVWTWLEQLSAFVNNREIPPTEKDLLDSNSASYDSVLYVKVQDSFQRGLP